MSKKYSYSIGLRAKKKKPIEETTTQKKNVKCTINAIP